MMTMRKIHFIQVLMMMQMIIHVETWYRLSQLRLNSEEIDKIPWTRTQIWMHYQPLLLHPNARIAYLLSPDSTSCAHADDPNNQRSRR